jgi:acetyltransferase-like isoleucine patch superfamily enzyme
MISKLIIIGAGALGREVVSMVNVINKSKKQFEIIGFLDDIAVEGTEIRSLKVLGLSQKIGSFNNTKYIIAIGNPELRKFFYEKVKLSNCFLPNLIHPIANIDDFCITNWDEVEGNIICASANISCDVIIGNNNLINVASILSHDTKIGNHNTIMQGSVINGLVTIGDKCFISSGITISGQFELNSKKITNNLVDF